VAAGGLLAVAAGLGADQETAAKHHHKTRCRKRQQSCNAKKRCCNKDGNISCEPVPARLGCEAVSGSSCCGQPGASCTDECDCCDDLACVVKVPTTGTTGKTVGKCRRF
jgi:hypothetical protein